MDADGFVVISAILLVCPVLGVDCEGTDWLRARIFVVDVVG
jgi:hypothetical protein